MIYEHVIEEFLVENLGLIEEGLTLVERQHSVTGIGRVDLLCRDKLNNLVIVELKLSAGKDSLRQITKYKDPIKNEFGENPRLILGYLRENKGVSYLYEQNRVKLVQIKDPRIPKRVQFKHLSWEERSIIYYFLSKNSYAADYTFTLASQLDMTEKALMKHIEEIRKNTSLNIEENRRRKSFTELRLKL
mgnify:FL=1